MKNRTGYSLVLKSGEDTLFASRGRGLRPLLECVARFAGAAEGRTVIDRVIGAAAARVIAAGRLADRAEAGVISRTAIPYLRERGIEVAWEEAVDCILAPDGSGTCPLEELSRRHPSDREFLTTLYQRFSLDPPEFVQHITKGLEKAG